MVIRTLYRNTDFDLGGLGTGEVKEKTVELDDEQKAELKRQAESKTKLEGETEEQFQSRLKVMSGDTKNDDDKDDDKKDDDEGKNEDRKDDDEPLDVIGTLQKEFGEVEGKKFEPTLDGVKEYISDLKPTWKKAGIEEYLEEKPIIKAFVNHIESGKSIDTFMQRQVLQDFSKVNVTKDTPKEHLVAYIKADLKQTGLEEYMIDSVITNFEDKDVVLAESQKSIKRMKDRQEALVKIQEEEELEANQEQARKNLEEVNSVKAVITKGDILGINISKDEATKLNDYIFKPVKGNKTQRDLDWEALGVDQSVFLDYLLMSKKLKPVVKASKTNTQNLNDELSKNKSGVINQNNSGGTGKKVESRFPQIFANT